MPKRSRTSEASTPSCFVDGALETDAPARRFAQASPYSHVRLDTLIDESLLLQVRKELQLLQSTFKETDMFKVYQTGDLANVDPDDEQHKAVLPATIALRKALYSDAFPTPPPGAESAASLAQLQGGVAGPLNAGGMPQAKPVRPVKLRRALAVAHEEKLRLWLNPAYLQPANISAIKAQLKQQGAALLANFLRPEIAAAILAKLRRYMRYRAPKDASGAPAPRLELGGDDGEAEDGMGAMTAIQQARLGAILDESTVHTLDATLAFVGKSAESRALWDSGDVGGFECHVPASKEELTAAEVYRADESTAGVTSIHASFNALSLVMRAPETMKFIKYVSCEAPGSRWDVAAEYASNGPTSAAAMPSPG